MLNVAAATPPHFCRQAEAGLGTFHLVGYSGVGAASLAMRQRQRALPGRCASCGCAPNMGIDATSSAVYSPCSIHATDQSRSPWPQKNEDEDGQRDGLWLRPWI